MLMAQMTRSALSAQKIKVCDINYVPSPETRFCFHLCCGELTFTWRQVFTILRLNLVIMWISKNTKFIIFFQWSTSIKWILPEVPTKNCKKQKFSMGFHFTISSIFLQKILQDLRRGRDNLSKSACRPQTKVVSTSSTGPILIWTTRLFLRWSAHSCTTTNGPQCLQTRSWGELNIKHCIRGQMVQVQARSNLLFVINSTIKCLSVWYEELLIFFVLISGVL